MEHLQLKQIRTNNLNIDALSLPLGRLSVVTGVSGSGKSSLVFDTLYAEAYRRYVESLSSFARQYLKALPKPDIGLVENLPPAIAVRQSRSGATSRSTVGTMTEINDLLRVIYTYFSTIICPQCQLEVVEDTPETIAAKLVKANSDQQVTIMAPLQHLFVGKVKGLRSQLSQQGFSRVWVDGEICKLEAIAEKKLKEAFLVVDRLEIGNDNFRRLAEACQLALKVGDGRVYARIKEDNIAFSSHLACPNCERKFAQPTLAMFSFNHPVGACANCQGFGAESAIDWDKVFPDLEQSLFSKGVVAWNWGRSDECYRDAITSGKARGIKPQKPFSLYTQSEWEWIKFGDGKRFDGVKGYFSWLDSHRHKAHYRIHSARFRKYVTCSVCHGGRLNPTALACYVEGVNFPELTARHLSEFEKWLEKVENRYADRMDENRLEEGIMGVREALCELRARLSYLQRVGLGYLRLDRPTRTLSGGEQQRINMARCLGSALTSTLYCLDEPTAGLHARDSENLRDVLLELRDQGNTVVVVEHESAIIKSADYLVEIGPESGHRGGLLSFAGLPPDVPSATPIKWGKLRSPIDASHWIELTGANTHNLKNVDAKFPVGALSVVCGVSGSGKTSLVQHTLYPMIAKILGSPVEGYVDEGAAKAVGPKNVLSKFSQIVHVSQGSLGRSSRSNIATYLGIYEDIRKILAATPAAQARALTPGHFSFNTSGGRCEECRGLGTVVEDLSFLGDMEVVCPACDGKRFGDEVLAVEYKGKNLLDILRMSVAELAELFYDIPAIAQSLQRVIDVGLGYVSVGQNTSSFSGGEAQRLKLLRLLIKTESNKPSILIFDEPTTGLSDRDVVKLLQQFDRLCRDGHTLIVVEHHLGVIQAADWLIEVGPEAANDGGEIVFSGPPNAIKSAKRSVTAKFLEKI